METKDIDTGLSTIGRYWTTDEANVLQLAYELQDAECGVLRENKIVPQKPPQEITDKQTEQWEDRR